MQGDNPEAHLLPTWKTARDTTLTALYEIILQRRVRDLQRSESITLSFDGWTGHDVQGSLIGVNYHWIDRQWKQHSATLDLVQVQSSQTGMNFPLQELIPMQLII